MSQEPVARNSSHGKSRGRRRGSGHTRVGALATLGVVVAMLGSACGAPLPKLEPGQSPSSYSGLEVTESRIEYAIGKVTDIVEEELEASGVPGAAVAVVHGGEVVLAEGFGVRNTETGEGVDPDTVFPMASISKPVSATVVAAATSGGKVEWSTPVREKLPWFQLSDPRVSAEVTVGDLFAHRSGLPDHAGDDLEDLGYPRQTVMHGLRRLPLEPFRASYAYTNFGLTVGAEAVAAAEAKPWADLSQELVFDPLGMDDTSFANADLLERGNRAVGHVRAVSDSSSAPSGSAGAGKADSDARSNGDWIPADPQRNPDAQAPAGGLSSSVNDMATWMTMVLAGGAAPDGTQVVPEEALREALTPQIVSSPPRSAADRAGTYGYGFDISTTSSGRVQWSHSGAFTLGAATAMLMIPSLDLGIITLTNSTPVGVPETINARFADLTQYGDPALEWRDLYSEAFGPLTAPMGDLASEQPPASPEPAPPARDLLGTYRNDYFGEIEVRESAQPEADRAAESDDGSPAAQSALEVTVGPDRQIWRLDHWDGATFAVSPTGENWPAGSRGSVVFDGDTVTVDLLDENGWGTFTRVEE